MMVIVNLNDHVWVRLTDLGRELHREQHEALRKDVPKLGPYREPQEDAEGFTKWQLWQLMQHFGPAICLGCDPPFDLTIRLTEP